MKLKKEGYVHPYHSEKTPITFNIRSYQRIALAAIGPEYVSPHYESFTRSRRFIFALGGCYLFNELITSFTGSEMSDYWKCAYADAMAILVFSLGYAEIRHFHYFLMIGQKFSWFYDVYTKLEESEMLHSWPDRCEQANKEFMVATKEQLEYHRIHKEYEFVKRRSIMNYAVNQRKELETNIYLRAVKMLESIAISEKDNLRSIISKETIDALSQAIEKIKTDKDLKKLAFDSAIDGIKKGSMDYSKDPFLPLLQSILNDKLGKMKTLNPEEQAKLIQLTAHQKRIIAETDQKLKAAFLNRTPELSNSNLKAHPKYRELIDKLNVEH